MKRLTSTMVVTMLLISSSQADVIKPNDVRATSHFGVGLNIQNLVNGDQAVGGLPHFGLIPAGDPNTILDDEHGVIFGGADPNVASPWGWISGCNSAGIPGGSTGEEGADCTDTSFGPPVGGAFTTKPVDDQIVEFEFDGAYDISAAHIWNDNEDGVALSRGLNEFQMQYSTDRTGNTFIDVGDPNNHPTLTVDDGFSNNLAQVVLFTDPNGVPLAASGARRVRFLLNSAHSGIGGNNEYVGLSEVRFEGTLVTSDLAADGTGPVPNDPNDVFNLHRGARDGEVSGLDFLLWQAWLGSGERDDLATTGISTLNTTLTATHSTADYDNNNVVNQLDLAVWEAEYGSTSPLSASSASSASVPEPFSLMLMATAALGGLLTRRRRIRSNCTGCQLSTFLAEAGDRSYRQKE